MSETVFSYERFSDLAARVAAEGSVLLENENRALPLAKGEKIALFGRASYNYYKSGTGSGGMVNVNHVVDIPEALAKDNLYELNAEVDETYRSWLKDHPYDAGKGWGNEPWFQEEMPLSDELIRKAAAESDTAVIVLGRTAGEDHDNAAEPGSYLLTKDEEEMLGKICGAFRKSVVLLNISNIIDTKWVKAYRPSAVLIIWQGGEAGCLGVADLLSGKESPSGRLPDTIAWDIADYPSTAYFGDPEVNVYHEDVYVGYRYFETFCPEKVLYPFGYGLSYTTFDVSPAAFTWDGTAKGRLSVTARVTNTGDAAGRETVMLFAEKPQGKLGQPVRSLMGFAKTDVLAPGESAEVVIEADPYMFASYDDDGRTGMRSAYVLEAGSYVFHVGSDVRNTRKAGEAAIQETVLVLQLAEAEAPVREAARLVPGAAKEDGTFAENEEPMPLRTVSPLEKRAKWLPKEAPCAGDLGWKLKDVAEGRVSMEVFISQLSDEELCQIMRGEGMNSPKVTAGTGGAFGGVTEALRHYGIPIGCCTDGPSGIRMDCGTRAFAMPNGTMMAATFNTELIREIYVLEGLELRKNKVDLLLGPGLNIHRNPLNGRNFEYFSEDPLLTGRMAAVQLLGMQESGVNGVIKHFACNNQEWKRHSVDAVVSERALREIYLKAFELAVKEGGATAVMSTYGRLNGTYTSSSYDLLTTILREEWGFDGIVMTDWWSAGSDEDGPGSLKMTAVQARAQNDLNMVNTDSLTNSNGDNYLEGLAEGLAARADYERCAANICRELLRLPVFMHSLGGEDELDRELAKCRTEEDEALSNPVNLVISGDVLEIDPAVVPTSRGKNVLFHVSAEKWGIYKLVLDCRVEDQGPLSQVPVSIFQDKALAGMVSLTGMDTETRRVEVQLSPIMMTGCFLKFFFGESGMRFDRIALELVQDMTEAIKAYMAQQS